MHRVPTLANNNYNNNNALFHGNLPQYEGPVTPHKTWFDVLAECSFGLMGGAGQGGAAEAEPAPTSTVVRIGNVVTPEELTDDEAQKEVSTVITCTTKQIARRVCVYSWPCMP